MKKGVLSNIAVFLLGATIVTCIAVCFWLYITGVQPMQVEKEIEGIIRAGVELDKSAELWAQLQDMNEDEVSPEEAEDTEQQFDQNLLRRIDFDELMGINPDATRWLYIPDTNVDYYVMQEQTPNEYAYLYKNIYNEGNWWGSILTPAIPNNQDDAHMLIFGHHMDGEDAIAFSRLPYFCDKSYGQARPYVYIYYPDHAERWRTWAAAQVSQYDDVYEVPYVIGSDKYDSLLQHIHDSAYYTLTDRPSKMTRTTILSTCNGWGERFILGCVPDMAYYYPKEEDTSSESSSSSETGSQVEGS